MPLGLVGLGRLGASLARGLSRAQVADVWCFSRTRRTAEKVLEQAPGLRLLDSAAEVFACCDPIFVWMAPADAADVFAAHAEVLRARQPLIVTCSPGQDPGAYTPRWADTLPNVNSSTGEGVTLLTWGPGLSQGDRDSVLTPLRACGPVYEVSAEQLPLYSALASNGPAFYARAMEAWADLLADRHGLDRAVCRTMVQQTVAGTIALQQQDGVDAAEVIRRVAHPGASTEQGLRVLDQHLDAVGEQMLRAMGKW